MLPGDELKDMEARLKALEGALANLEARTVRMSVSLSVSVGLSCLSVSLSLSLSPKERDSWLWTLNTSSVCAICA